MSNTETNTTPAPATTNPLQATNLQVWSFEVTDLCDRILAYSDAHPDNPWMPLSAADMRLVLAYGLTNDEAIFVRAEGEGRRPLEDKTEPGPLKEISVILQPDFEEQFRRESAD